MGLIKEIAQLTENGEKQGRAMAYQGATQTQGNLPPTRAAVSECATPENHTFSKDLSVLGSGYPVMNSFYQGIWSDTQSCMESQQSSYSGMYGEPGDIHTPAPEFPAKVTATQARQEVELSYIPPKGG